ncbi:hypothetical protein ABZ923_00010 [Streptomyces sp. NPDC046881]|uniref:hypothetical protein n=1 Tax=Streptomyces sp. NPDC046881 TaxID=3155374 RepID=UPI003405BE37
MAKHGSNDLKARARRLAAKEGISYAAALQRLRAGHEERTAKPTPRTDPDRWRAHGPLRDGLCWLPPLATAETGVRVSVPRSVRAHRLWIERIEPLLIDRWDGATPHVACEHRDLLLEVLRAVCGRTGRELEPTEYVDVDVRLDAVRAEGRLLLEWAGVELAHAGDHHSWTSPRLTHCEVLAGTMLLETERQGKPPGGGSPGIPAQCCGYKAFPAQPSQANLPMPTTWWPSARTIPPIRCVARAGGCWA